MKTIGFIIHSNILIALAAVSLAMATGSELGMPLQWNAYLLVIFMATLCDYNLHRFISIHKQPETSTIEKMSWAVKHLDLLKVLILLSSAGLVISLFFVRIEIVFVLIPMALISFFYSLPIAGKHKKTPALLGIAGMKTLLLALVWTSATVIVPALLSGNAFNQAAYSLIFAERFTYIFAIAIPFDVRDMKADALSGIQTLPVSLGEKKAMLVSNASLAASLLTAVIHYLTLNMPAILPAYIASIALTLVFINGRKMKSMPFYYHGILDGSIVLHGLLISLSIFF